MFKSYSLATNWKPWIIFAFRIACRAAQRQSGSYFAWPSRLSKSRERDVRTGGGGLRMAVAVLVILLVTLWSYLF